MSAQQTTNMQPANDQQAQQGKRTPAEWTTLGIVLLLLGALIGVLVWYALETDTYEPTFTVQVDMALVEERNDRFYVPVRIKNTGEATAEDVTLHAEISENDEVVEEAELTFRFVSGGEEADGVMVFARDPRSSDFEIGVTSYLNP